MPVLIIGSSSFIGRHLAKELRTRGLEVAGTYRHSESHLEGPLYQLDILDQPAVRKVLEEVRPETVFHLAAETTPSRTWADPESCYRVNLDGTVNVAHACVDQSPPPRLVFPSSVHVYGTGAPEDRGIRETDPCNPVSPYGIAKWKAEQRLAEMAEQAGLRSIIFRLFNQFGPGQKGHFFISEMAEAVARLERTPEDKPKVIRTGNLELRRDFMDVRDGVRALALTAEPENAAPMEGKTYNLGRGEALRLSEILRILIDAAEVPIQTETDPAKLRTDDPAALWADVSRLALDTGWNPIRDLKTSLLEVLEERRGT